MVKVARTMEAGATRSGVSTRVAVAKEALSQDIHARHRVPAVGQNPLNGEAHAGGEGGINEGNVDLCLAALKGGGENDLVAEPGLVG